MVPVLLILLVFLLVVVIARTQSQVSKLDKTDRIACSFIIADATTRKKQATNSSLSLTVELRYITKTSALIALFNTSQAKAAAKKQTAAQRSGSAVFEAYLRAQQTVWLTNTGAQRKNIGLTRDLASKATRLARELHC